MDYSDDFDIRTFLPYMLNQAAEASSLRFQKVYKDRYGMLRTEWRVLFHLGMFGQMTAREISLAAGLHKTKISRAVQRLNERRFVLRMRDAQDRRVEQLKLTASGRAAFEDLRAVARAFDAELTARLSAQDTKVLRRALHLLAQDGLAEAAEDA